MKRREARGEAAAAGGSQEKSAEGKIARGIPLLRHVAHLCDVHAGDEAAHRGDHKNHKKTDHVREFFAEANRPSPRETRRLLLTSIFLGCIDSESAAPGVDDIEIEPGTC